MFFKGEISFKHSCVCSLYSLIEIWCKCQDKWKRIIQTNEILEFEYVFGFELSIDTEQLSFRWQSEFSRLQSNQGDFIMIKKATVVYHFSKVINWLKEIKSGQRQYQGGRATQIKTILTNIIKALEWNTVKPCIQTEH